MRPQIARLFTWRTAITESDLHPTTRHVLLTLSLHMSEAGSSCFPSVQSLCKETGLNKSTIIRQLKIAGSEGWLVKKTHGYTGQGWRRNEYEAKVPKVVAQSDHEGGCTEQPPRKKVVALTTKGGRFDDTKVVAQSDLSSSVNSTKNSTGKRKSIKTTLPNDFCISDGVRKWAKEKGHSHLDEHFENFVLAVEKGGYTYANWDAALKSAIRDDWAKLKSQPPANNGPRSKPLAH